MDSLDANEINPAQAITEDSLVTPLASFSLGIGQGFLETLACGVFGFIDTDGRDSIFAMINGVRNSKIFVRDGLGVSSFSGALASLDETVLDRKRTVLAVFLGFVGGSEDTIVEVFLRQVVPDLERLPICTAVVAGRIGGPVLVSNSDIGWSRAFGRLVTKIVVKELKENKSRVSVAAGHDHPIVTSKRALGSRGGRLLTDTGWVAMNRNEVGAGVITIFVESNEVAFRVGSRDVTVASAGIVTLLGTLLATALQDPLDRPAVGKEHAGEDEIKEFHDFRKATSNEKNETQDFDIAKTDATMQQRSQLQQGECQHSRGINREKQNS